VARLILNALEAEVGDLLALPAHSPDVAPGLAFARTALEKAKPWSSSSEWLAVHAALNTKSDEVAVRAIAEAQKKVQADDLAAAVRTIEPALVLGGPHSQRVARELHEQWNFELSRRQDLAAQEELHGEIREFWTSQRYLDAWDRIQEFRQRFPNSTKPLNMSAVLPTVQQAVGDLLKQMDADYQNKNWGQYRAGADRLPSLPLTTEQQTRLPQIQLTLAEFETRAAKQFGELQSYKYMTSDRQVLPLLDALPEVLALNPRHEEAEKMLQNAQKRSKQLAQYFLLQAQRVGGRNVAAYREHLQRVVTLDRDGPHGREAQALLKASASGDTN
jgi:hypothetical protein